MDFWMVAWIMDYWKFRSPGGKKNTWTHPPTIQEKNKPPLLPTFTHSTPNPTYTHQTKQSLIFPGRKTLIFSSRNLSSLIFKDSLLPEHSGTPKFFDKRAMTCDQIWLGSCKWLPSQLSHNFVSKAPDSGP